MGHRLDSLRAGWANGKRWKILGVVLIISILLSWGGFALFIVTRPATLKPWAPITTPDVERIACLNVSVPGVCLTPEPIMTDEDGPGGNEPVQVSLPTLHIPKGGPFPDVPVKTQRCTTTQVDTEFESWTQELLPVDGTYDHDKGGNTLLGGCTQFTVSHKMGPEQQQRVKDLYSKGITTTVWQIRGTQEPVSQPPAGTYPVGIVFQTDNYAIVYG